MTKSTATGETKNEIKNEADNKEASKDEKKTDAASGGGKDNKGIDLVKLLTSGTRAF